jgi:AraC-like DNA-binding protein
MSRPNFFRRFKEYFGVTPVEYIQQEKIKTAKEYLSRPETTVSEVALLLGYQNMNHFIRMFKHFEGLTPKQFQIQNRQIWLRMNWR